MKHFRTSKIVVSSMAAGAILLGGSEGASAIDAVESNQKERGMVALEQVLAAPDPDAAMSNLSTIDRKAFDNVVLPVKTEVTKSIPQLDVQATQRAEAAQLESGRVMAPTSCWTNHVTFKAKAAAGNVVYTWWQGLRWCASGGKVTSYKVYSRGGETSTPGWSYEGRGGSGSRLVGNEVRQYTQEKFRFITKWVGFTNTKCAQVRGIANGTYTSRANCSL